MKEILAEELINYKILPFDLYSEFGEKLLSVGDVLTPGKLLQLRHMDKLYKDEPIQTHTPFEKQELKERYRHNSKYNDSKNRQIIEKFEMEPSQLQRDNFTVDEIDISNFKGPVNKTAKINHRDQLKIKAYYNKIIDEQEERHPLETLEGFVNLKDKLLNDVIFRNSDISYGSQVKFIGEYEKCHAINVAILSGFIAKRMELSDTTISDIILGGLLHDIGQTKMPDNNKTNLTNKELKETQEHTNIGYKILKEEMGIPENIALIALEHHEHNDGSGYPLGKSGDLISQESQIVSVCNYYDNLTFNRTLHLVKNGKDALRMMMELGTKYFSPEVLYTFIHMFSYNDVLNFEDMVL